MVKKIILTAILIFFFGMIKIAPVVYKGYAPSGLHDNLVLSRNLALTGEYKLENKYNVILASSKIKSEGVQSTFGNKLSVYLEAGVFKLFGFSHSLPFYFSVFLFAMSGVFVFFITYRIFGNYWLAVSVASVDSFMPFVWKGSLMAGSYEFATFFFFLGLLFYFWKEKISWSLLFVSGLFFGLSALCRNAFLISSIVLIGYEFYKNKSWQRLALLAMPFFIIFGAMGVYNNSYLVSADESFARYGHLFPDPYTYHFEKQEYLNKALSSSDPDVIEFMIRYDQKIPFLSKIKVYAWSAFFYAKESLSIINFGGPIFLFLFFVGGLFLHKDKKEIFYIFSSWLVLLYLGLIFLKTNNWDHFLEIRLVLAIFITYGAWKIGHIIKDHSDNNGIKKIIAIGLMVFLSAQLFYSNKWLFHQDYEISYYPKAIIVADKIKEIKANDDDIIAVDHNQNAPFMLNYLTDKSFLYFSPETIDKLEKENKLKEVFKTMGVTKAFIKNNFFDYGQN